MRIISVNPSAHASPRNIQQTSPEDEYLLSTTFSTTDWTGKRLNVASANDIISPPQGSTVPPFDQL